MGKSEAAASPQQLSLDDGSSSWAPRERASSRRPVPDPRDTALEAGASRGEVIVERGVAAAENALFESLDAALSRRRDLSRPLRIVVPSGGLRNHLSRALVRHHGRALLGVTIQTHFALALEALERIGEAPAPGGGFGALLSERLIREGPALGRVAGRFRGAGEGVRASLRDLLDAGFRDVHLEAALECLAEGGLGPAEDRVAALLEGASWWVHEQAQTRHLDAALLLEEAVAALAARGPALLPTETLFIYGVADATGALADWLEALLTTYRGTLFLNQPADPADPAQAETRYTADFIERLEARELHCRKAAPALAEALPPLPRLVCAETPQEEVESVVSSIRRALDAGVEPEGVAICARRFDDYRGLLIGALDTWAIPYSSQGLASSGGATQRVVNACAALLQEAGNLDIDTWLGLDAGASFDLRSGLHQMGFAKLSDWCGDPEARDAGGESGDREELPAEGLALGVRRDLETSRRLRREEFDRARTRAEGTLRALAVWPGDASAEEHRACLAALLAPLVEQSRAHREAKTRLDGIAAELPRGLRVGGEEWRTWCSERVEALPGAEPGGAGAGVQVLSVMAARERRFAHLFVLGLARENFPRLVADDPLFPEAQRARLRAVLPDLPLKRRGHDEERHLFASLLGAADHVTLSRSAFTATGRESPESPLLLRLRLAHPDWPEERAADVAVGLPRPVEAAALGAALHRDSAALSPLLVDALRVRQHDRALCRDGVAPQSHNAKTLAAGLIVLWNEFDVAPGERSAAALGPFFGWVTPHPAEREPFITEIADLLRCPWQRFLRRELRIRPAPDAAARLPSPDARMRGSTVHHVLERVVEDGREGAARDLESRVAAGARPAPWPDSATLEAWTLEAAEDAARREGIRGDLFPRLLARSLAPALAQARELDEARRADVYGAELEGFATLPGRSGRRLRFRVDRVEAGAAGSVLVEFKSGRAFLDRVQEATRVRQLGNTLERGEGIQVPAYLYAPDAEAARLVFLGPGTPRERRETTLRGNDDNTLARFRERSGAALRALDLGLRPPRLISKTGRGAGEPCTFCEMRMACLQGDTAQLGRMRERLEAPRRDPDAAALDLLFGKETPR